MSSAALTTSRPEELKGDLISAPGIDDWYRIDEIYTLEKMIPYAPAEDKGTMRRIIRERIQMCRAELDAVGIATRQTMLETMGPQFRLRMDFQRLKLACEQWMPSLKLWLINGYYEPNYSARRICDELKAADPTRPENDPLTQLAQRREQAAQIRARNEAEGDARVQDAIDALPERAVKQFVEVESALRTGEQITFRGDDARKLEGLVDSTKMAARHGDLEAQQVLTHGQRDTPALVRVPRKRRRSTNR